MFLRVAFNKLTMKKNEQLNKWLWKWHFIAGLISLPFILLLSVTGVIYMFKADYEAPKQKTIKEVVIQENDTSFQDQWETANKHAIKKPNGMVIPTQDNQATEFVSGRFGGKSSLYINPYKNTVSGEIIPKNSLMFKVRKLHGELLLGNFGTKIVELIASWMVVLILSGLYIWWPARGWKLKGFFIPRFKEDKRTFYRDLHAILGFWSSIVLLLILAGGFPWTSVFGDNFKQVQKITNTGYPSTWNGKGINSSKLTKTLQLDKVVHIAKNLKLAGDVTIQFPKGKNGVYRVSNRTPELNLQKVHLLDQYTGKEILKHSWEDVGVLMRGRMWLMAFHQGEFGLWNWILIFSTGIALIILCVSGIVSYLLRKRKGKWGVPKVPENFNIGYGIISIVLLLGIVFPLFGISIIVIFLIELLRKKLRAV